MSDDSDEKMERGVKLELLKDGVRNQRKRPQQKEDTKPIVRKRDIKTVKKKSGGHFIQESG